MGKTNSKMKILILSLGGVFGASRREHVEHVEHMNGIIDEDQTKELREMEPEKAKAFIEKLFVKIDKNQSGKIEKTETINWIRELEENYIKRDSIEEFKAFDSNGDRFITFEEIRKLDQIPNDDKNSEYRKAVHKFGMCDKNKDTKLSESEFEGFLHPQFFEHTRGIYVQENFEAFDQNSDHKIDAKEFLREHLRIDPESNEEDELEAFSDIDGDSNGHIDMAEMQRWLYPSDYDPAETEFHHLLTEADTDMDGRLSKDEILENYHVLLESEATRWGAMGHEEL